MKNTPAVERYVLSWMHRYPRITGGIAAMLVIGVTIYITNLNNNLYKQTEIRESEKVVERIDVKIREVLHYSELAAISLLQAIDENGEVQNFDSVSAQILRTADFIDVLELVPDGVIRYAYPLKGNESVIGYDILSDPKTNKEAEIAKAKNKMFFAGPFKLKQGGTAVVGRLPIFVNNKFWGFAAVLIHLDHLLNYAGIDNTGESGYYFQFSKVNPNTYEEEFFLPQVRGMNVSAPHSIASFPEGQWNIHIMPIESQDYDVASWWMLF
ncbi:CHASE domain-containing protein, partial [Bacteroidota bacterium]